MTKGTKILGVTIATVGLLFLGRVGVGILSQPTDEALISEAIAESIKASKEGRAGGVLDFFSKNFSLNNAEVPEGRSEVSKYIRNMKPDVEFASTKPVIMGDEAKIETSAKMTVSILSMSQTANVPNVTISLKKEEERSLLLIPVKKWRITGIQVPLDSIPKMLMGGE